MTDGEWDDFTRVTPERVRKWVAKEAAKLRKAEERLNSPARAAVRWNEKFDGTGEER